MEKNNLSIINESDYEKSESMNSSLSMPKEMTILEQTEQNYNFLRNFHQNYEKNEFKIKNDENDENEAISAVTTKNKATELPKKKSDNNNINPQLKRKFSLSSNVSLTSQIKQKQFQPRSPIKELRRYSSTVSDHKLINIPKEPEIYKNILVRNDSQYQLSPFKPHNKFEKRRFTITDNQIPFKLDNIKDESRNENNKQNDESIDTNQARKSFSSNDVNSQKENLITKQKNELTLDKVVQEINKPFLTFSKRRMSLPMNNFFNLDLNKIKENIANAPTIIIIEEPDVINDNKLEIKIKTNIKNVKKSSQSNLNVNPMSNYSKFDNSIYIENSKLKNHKKYIKIQQFMGRMKIYVHVLSFLNFVKIENIKYGVRPKTRKPLIDKKDIVKTDFSVNMSLNQNFSVLQILAVFNLDIKLKTPWFIVSPDSTFYKIWYKIHFCLLVYFCFIATFRLSFTNSCFNSNNGFAVFFDLIVEALFLFDFCVNMILAFYDNEGQLIISFNKIVYIYFSSLGLFLDSFSLLPFYYFKINSLFGIQIKNAPFNLLLFLRNIKLFLEINKTIFLQAFQERFYIHTGTIKIIKKKLGVLKLYLFLVNAVISCHTFACIFYYIFLIEEKDSITWIFKGGFQDDSLGLIYLKSLYFSFTSFITVGYGDITPFSNLEIIIVCFWLLFSGIFYTFSISSLSKIFLEYSSQKFLLNNKCLIITETFKKAKLPSKIREDTLQYLRNTYFKNKEKISYVGLRAIFSELPSNLKFSIATEIYDGAVHKINIFNSCTKNFISNIVPLLQPLNISKNMLVYQCGEVPYNMYFISKGSVKFLNEDGISFSSLNEGTYFGEIEILRKTYRENSVNANINCFLLTLSKNIIWEDIITNYSEFVQLLLENMIKRHNYYERMRDLIDFIIDEGRKTTNIKQYETSIKNKSNFSNYNKHCFYIGLGSSIKNGINKSNLLKLSEMLNNSLNNNVCPDEEFKNSGKFPFLSLKGENKGNDDASSKTSIEKNNKNNASPRVEYIDDIYTRNERKKKKKAKGRLPSIIEKNLNLETIKLINMNNDKKKQRNTSVSSSSTADKDKYKEKLNQIFEQNKTIIEMINKITIKADVSEINNELIKSLEYLNFSKNGERINILDD